MLNWLANIHTRRMLIDSSASFEKPTSYGSMFSSPKVITRTFTLAFMPHLARNFCMGLAMLPKHMGAMDEVIAGIFALGAAAVSHPFEVARILIVKNDGGRTIPTLKALYSAEGVAGMFKGFVPRALVMVPTLMGMQYAMNPRHNTIYGKVEGFSDKQEGY